LEEEVKNKLAISILIISQTLTTIGRCESNMHPNQGSKLSNIEHLLNHNFPDWQVTDTQRYYCGGYYQPLYDHNLIAESAQAIQIQADKTLYRPQGPSELIGDV